LRFTSQWASHSNHPSSVSLYHGEAEVGFLCQSGNLSYGVHLQKVRNRYFYCGKRIIVLPFDVAQFNLGVFIFSTQRVDIRLVHIAGSKPQPFLRLGRAETQRFLEVPVVVVHGEGVGIHSQLFLFAQFVLARRTCHHHHAAHGSQ